MSRNDGTNLKTGTGAYLALMSLVLAATLVGCAPTMLVNVWRDPSIASPHLNKMMVVSLRNDATRRRMWEDAFVSELSKHGVAATASYHLYPNAAPDTAQMRQAVEANDFNGVLSVSPISSDVESDYAPGYWAIQPNLWFRPYWGRYYRQWHLVYAPGYVQTYAFRSSEVDVYMTHDEGEAMVWSGTCDQTEPATMEDIRASIAGQVVSKLGEQGIIPNR